MAKINRTKSVPQNMRATYDIIVALTDHFCRDHLDDEYRELAQRMAEAAAGAGSNIWSRRKRQRYGTTSPGDCPSC